MGVQFIQRDVLKFLSHLRARKEHLKMMKTPARVKRRLKLMVMMRTRKAFGMKLEKRRKSLRKKFCPTRRILWPSWDLFRAASSPRKWLSAAGRGKIWSTELRTVEVHRRPEVILKCWRLIQTILCCHEKYNGYMFYVYLCHSNAMISNWLN